LGIREAKRELASIDMEVKVFTARVAEWKPMPMPLERLQMGAAAGKAERAAKRAELAARK